LFDRDAKILGYGPARLAPVSEDLKNLGASDDANYWSIEHSSGRQALRPCAARRIYGYEIPKNSAPIAAIGPGIGIARRGHSRCHGVVLIPELTDSLV